MYLQKIISKLTFLLEGHWRKQKDPGPDPLITGTDQRIWFSTGTKVSWIRNTVKICKF